MQEQEPKTNGQLPIISEDTVNQLRGELGLNISGSTEYVLQGITRERQITVDEKNISMTSDVFLDVASVNPKLAEALRNGIIKGLFLSSDVLRMNSVINGMALVIKAFHLESNFNLVERFKEISEDQSLAKVEEIVRKGLGEGRQMDIIEQALKIPKISDVQIGLNNLVEETAKRSYPYNNQLRMGASLMYAVLSEFKSKLFPPPNSSQNPPANLSSSI